MLLVVAMEGTTETTKTHMENEVDDKEATRKIGERHREEEEDGKQRQKGRQTGKKGKHTRWQEHG